MPPLLLLESVGHLQDKEVLELELHLGQGLLQVLLHIVLPQISPNKSGGVHQSFVAEISVIPEINEVLNCDLRLRFLGPHGDF